MSDRLRLGCPAWAHAPWVGNFFTSDARRTDYLPQYASVFNAVEGNASFYGLPAVDTIQRWNAEAPEGFEFCFKFPRVVSHDLLLRHAERETLEFIERLEPLGDRLGPFFLQLPMHFEPRHLKSLIGFLEGLPSRYRYAVEVRNQRFFNGTVEALELEGALNQLGADRVVFDTRALFAGKAVDEETEEAQRKKPNLPVQMRATGACPFIRFVGHPSAALTDHYLRTWVNPVAEWLEARKRVYFFTHMPDDKDAPALGRKFLKRLAAAGVRVAIPPWPCELEPRKPEQMNLF